jgi:hypothetical protein
MIKTLRVNWYSQTQVDFTLMEDGLTIGSVTMSGENYDAFILALSFAGWHEDLSVAEDRTKVRAQDDSSLLVAELLIHTPHTPNKKEC